jgi:hypothetical protein
MLDMVSMLGGGYAVHIAPGDGCCYEFPCIGNLYEALDAFTTLIWHM